MATDRFLTPTWHPKSSKIIKKSISRPLQFALHFLIDFSTEFVSKKLALTSQKPILVLVFAVFVRFTTFQLIIDFLSILVSTWHHFRP